MATLMGGLHVVARALSEGATARAMSAAVLLKVPELDWDGAARIARVEDALAKFGFDPDELRDRRGRWAQGGAGSAVPANDHLRAPGRADRSTYPGSSPFLPNADLDNAHLYDVEWYGDYHEEVKKELADHLRAGGLIVQTEVFLYLDGTDKLAKADIMAMLPGDPSTLTVVEIKTGPRRT